MPRPSPDLLDQRRYPFRHDMTTRYADLDPNNHVNNVAIAIAFEDARVRFARSLGLGVAAGQGTMIVSSTIEFLDQAHYPAPLTVLVAAAEIGRSSWTLASLVAQEERVCAFTRAVIVYAPEGRPVAMPDDFRAALERFRLGAV